MMGLYDNIKKYAAKKNISVLQLERLCGIPKGSMSRYNKNKPSVARLANIAEKLDVSVDVLVRGEDDSDKNAVEHQIGVTKEDVEKIVAEAMNQKQYYIDPESAEIAQELKDNPDMRILFDACRKVKPEHMKTVMKMLQSLSDD